MSDVLKVVGAIESKTSTPGVNKAGNNYTKHAISIAGRKFSGFHEIKFNVGDIVEVIYEQNGIFNNIKDIVLAGEAAKSSMNLSPFISSNVSNGNSSKDKLIIRQSCQTRALEYLRFLYEADKDAYLQLVGNIEGGLLKLVDAVALHFENNVWRE